MRYLICKNGEDAELKKELEDDDYDEANDGDSTIVRVDKKGKMQQYNGQADAPGWDDVEEAV